MQYDTRAHAPILPPYGQQRATEGGGQTGPDKPNPLRLQSGADGGRAALGAGTTRTDAIALWWGPSLLYIHSRLPPTSREH